jgi:hypothetical protein
MLLSAERQLLIRARRILLKQETRIGICTALYMATYPPLFEKDALAQMAYTRLRLYIGDALAPFATLESWQKHHGFYCGATTCRRDRLAWIDWMLGEEKESSKRLKDKSC